MRVCVHVYVMCVCGVHVCMWSACAVLPRCYVPVHGLDADGTPPSI